MSPQGLATAGSRRAKLVRGSAGDEWVLAEGPASNRWDCSERSARKAGMAASQQDLGCLLGGIRGPP